MNPRRRIAIRKALLDWYDCQRRPLPWRRNRNWYGVWIAETMLQQTRIASALPAYERFLHRFPDLQSLASASEEQVLSQWSGLGYYSRARNLHRAARQLASDNRAFPAEMKEARALPGVGSYTASAVLSIAYDRPHAVVDGNVRRVLARLLRLAGDTADYQRAADDLLDTGRPGDWNQAVMELGETICVPGAADCPACPLKHFCESHRHGVVADYPPPKKRPDRQRLGLTLLIARDRRSRLLLERGAFPYLRHLWLPLYLSDAPRGDFALAGEFRHAILHRDFVVRTYRCTLPASRLRSLAAGGSGERRIFAPDELEQIGRSSLLTKALRLSAPSEV